MPCGVHLKPDGAAGQCPRYIAPGKEVDRGHDRCSKICPHDVLFVRNLSEDGPRGRRAIYNESLQYLGRRKDAEVFPGSLIHHTLGGGRIDSHLLVFEEFSKFHC